MIIALFHGFLLHQVLTPGNHLGSLGNPNGSRLCGVGPDTIIVKGPGCTQHFTRYRVQSFRQLKNLGNSLNSTVHKYVCVKPRARETIEDNNLKNIKYYLLNYLFCHH